MGSEMCIRDSAQSFDKGKIGKRRLAAQPVFTGERGERDAVFRGMPVKKMQQRNGIAPARKRHAHPFAGIRLQGKQFHTFSVYHNAAAIARHKEKFAESIKKFSFFPENG